jgi:hypothetical protein
MKGMFAVLFFFFDVSGRMRASHRPIQDVRFGDGSCVPRYGETLRDAIE